MMNNNNNIKKALNKIYLRVTESSDQELRESIEHYESGDIAESLLEANFSLPTYKYDLDSFISDIDVNFALHNLNNVSHNACSKSISKSVYNNYTSISLFIETFINNQIFSTEDNFSNSNFISFWDIEVLEHEEDDSKLYKANRDIQWAKAA